ncbi:uncharacterized protein LOC143862039 [Tasmannia lanceolata]|uniref:uncharacterized protein LOC143862039 n=1 Tax=Tasmannia lanceolata TaxID=3420 RepID=UPI0040639CF9
MACGSVGHGVLHFLISPTTTPPPKNIKTLAFSVTASFIPCNRILVSQSRRMKRDGFLLQKASASVDRVELNENPEGIISGEWPENFSLLSYDDLRAYLEPEIFKEKMQPSALLGEVMSTVIRTATADQTLDEIDHHFQMVSGLPVIDEGLRCIGVISKKDIAKASDGLKSKVGEVLSSPAITLSPDKTVLDAAALMLKEKIHRIPIVNKEGQVLGMVTRTDIFRALEGLPA